MKTAIQRHPYLPGESDHAVLKPRQLCATCQLPKANARHTLPATPNAVRAQEARRLGETETE